MTGHLIRFNDLSKLSPLITVGRVQGAAQDPIHRNEVVADEGINAIKRRTINLVAAVVIIDQIDPGLDHTNAAEKMIVIEIRIKIVRIVTALPKLKQWT